MKRCLALIILFACICSWEGIAWSQNPFISKKETEQKTLEPPIKSRLFMKIILWQHTLKQKMSKLIRVAKDNGSLQPLILLMGLAFLYGVIHAAGPGHGKLIAMSYVLSRKASVMGGLMFSVFIAGMHGSSGIILVFGLRYIIQRSVSESLGTVTFATQIISFGLIVILGLGILLMNIYNLFIKKGQEGKKAQVKDTRKGILTWALAIGMVPCPAVVMVMLFCLSMGVLTLGLLLAACISFGMAFTISMVVSAVVLGKVGVLNAVSEKKTVAIEGVIGLFSGVVIAILGALFLLTTLFSSIY